MKRLSGAFLILGFLFFNFKDSSLLQVQREKPIKQLPSFHSADQKVLIKNLEAQPQRLPSGKKTGSKPASLKEAFVPHHGIKLPTNDIIAQNLKALPRSTYRPSMGKIIYQNHFFTFFEYLRPEDPGWPVSYNRTNNRFYPVSHILHIKGIDEEQRQKLQNDGHHEYHYNSKLKLLSLESTPQEVLDLYLELKNHDHDVRLEVLNQIPKPK